MQEVFIAIAAISVVAHVVLSIMVMYQLSKRNIPVNILLARLYIFKYVSQYRAVTIDETGHTGPLFYPWIVTINLALLSVLIAAFAF